MRTIGLIGGMSWESTAQYYFIINNLVKERLGGLSSAKIVLYSVNFEEIATLQRSGEWEKAGKLLNNCALSLERAGADCLVLCTNTMHNVSDALCLGVQIPLIHIAEVTAEAIKKRGILKVGLLGTRFTMEQSFYKDRLAGLNVLIPNETEAIHEIIFNELCLGIVKDESREIYKKSIQSLISKGAEGIILGCTEIGMLISDKDSSVPVFDTTKIHAEAAVEFALR